MALGWALARAGWDVTMVEVNPKKLDAGRREGVSVNGISECRLRFSDLSDWVPPEDTILLLATKTYDNAAVLARLPSRRFLVPVQNGFDPLLNASDHPIRGHRLVCFPM